MRALRRHFLAPLVMAAAVLSAGTPAFLASAAPVTHSAALSRGCPPGTNWDTALQACH